MWYSMHAFYNSTEWKNLKKHLEFIHTNADGDIICSHCHKPIMKNDLIWHHLVYLNLENVNDYSISLNEEKVVPVHMTCHNEIHERWGLFNQHIYIVYGPPLSGKTEFVRSRATKDDLVIDIDIIREAITGGCLYERSGYTTRDVFAVHDVLMDRITTKATKAKSVFIIGGYAIERQRTDLVKKIGAEEIFIDVSKEECYARLEHNNTGRDINAWKKYIDDWFFKYNYGRTLPSLT